MERHCQFIQTHGGPVRNPQASLDQGDEATALEPDLGLGTHLEDHDGANAELTRYFSDIHRRRANFEEADRVRKRTQKTAVLAWISASKKTQSLHKEFQDTRICPETGRWLFRRYREVTDWMKDDPPEESAIWLHARRGFGKAASSPPGSPS